MLTSALLIFVSTMVYDVIVQGYNFLEKDGPFPVIDVKSFIIISCVAIGVVLLFLILDIISPTKVGIATYVVMALVIIALVVMYYKTFKFFFPGDLAGSIETIKGLF